MSVEVSVYQNRSKNNNWNRCSNVIKWEVIYWLLI